MTRSREATGIERDTEVGVKSLAAAALLVSVLTACETATDVASTGDAFLYEVADAVTRTDLVTGERALNLDTKEADIERADAALAQIIADPAAIGARPGARLIPETDDRYGRLARIFDRVVSVSHAADERGKSVGFVYFDDPQWNAFALGGNKMVFFSGFTETVDDDELAAVIGHEMAHNTASHISETIASKLLVGLAGGDTGQAGWDEAYTLKHEQEADELGTLYAALAGYDPYAAARLWERIPDKGYPYFRTHPSSPERVQRNSATAARVYDYYRPGQVNPDARAILACNVLYCRQDLEHPQAGEGGGLVAAVTAAATAYLKQTETELEIARQEAEIARHAAQERERLLASAPNFRFPAGWMSFRGIGTDAQGQQGVALAFQGLQGIVIGNHQGRERRTDLQFHGQNAEGTWYRWFRDGREGLAVVMFDQSQNTLDARWFWHDGSAGGQWHGVRTQ